MSPDAREDKLFQDERGLLLAFQGPKLKSPKIYNTLKKIVLYLRASFRKPLQGKDEFVENN